MQKLIATFLIFSQMFSLFIPLPLSEQPNVSALFEVTRVINHDLILDRNDTIHLIYQEEGEGYSRIVYLLTENNQWNLTRNYLTNTTENIVGIPDLYSWNDSLLVSYCIQESIDNYQLKILQKTANIDSWQFFSIFNFSTAIVDPIIKHSENYLWLVLHSSFASRRQSTIVSRGESLSIAHHT